MNLDDQLRDRQNINGVFEDTAAIAQALKMLVRRGRNWDALSNEGKEALENVCTLIARILTGDGTEPEHWNSAAGFMRLRGAALNSNLEAGISRITNRLRTPPRIMETVKPPDEDGAA
jgi:hypothetical protein